jgi:hypothetical protein
MDGGRQTADGEVDGRRRTADGEVDSRWQTADGEAVHLFGMSAPVVNSETNPSQEDRG